MKPNSNIKASQNNRTLFINVFLMIVSSFKVLRVLRGDTSGTENQVGGQESDNDTIPVTFLHFPMLYIHDIDAMRRSHLPRAGNHGLSIGEQTNILLYDV
jgi:hypothetical protein